MTHNDHEFSPRSGSIDVAVRRLTDTIVLVDTVGEVDLGTHLTMRDALFDALVPPAPEILVADLSNVSFFSSSGVSTMVDAHQRAQTVGTELRVVCGSRAVMRPLVITTVDRLLNLYPDKAAACERPAAPLSAN
ncbi:MAG: anti-sigma factor antagonist [Actinophytocola sp.]|nr:anti-sigma factor antagonist [Actinophytocola sp.]